MAVSSNQRQLPNWWVFTSVISFESSDDVDIAPLKKKSINWGPEQHAMVKNQISGRAESEPINCDDYTPACEDLCQCKKIREHPV